jgi:hypothetical protein
MGASRNGLVGSFAVEFSDASCLPGLRSRLRQLIPAGDGRIDAELPDELIGRTQETNPARPAR